MVDVFEPDIPAIEFMLHDPGGLVGGNLRHQVEAGAALARAFAPRGKTGRLAAAVYSEIVSDGDGLIGAIGDDAPYARPVHQGSRAHDIRPRNASVLVWSSGGTQVFATIVHHPADAPHPFLVEALRVVGLNL